MKDSLLFAGQHQSVIRGFVQQIVHLVVCAARAVDHWLNPVSDWKWVGRGDALYQRTVDRNGFSFTAELVIDRRTVADYLGAFGDTWREDAVPASDGYFFYPAAGEFDRTIELVKSGISQTEAQKIAHANVYRDMKRAASYGETWFLYGLVVSAKRGNRELAEVSLWGIEATPHVERMDSRIESLFAELIPEAEREALGELKTLRTSAMLA
jgi:hypothetical protein